MPLLPTPRAVLPALALTTVAPLPVPHYACSHAQVANAAAKADARLGVYAHTALLAVSQGRRRALGVIEEVIRRGEATGSGGPLRAARRRLLAKAKARNRSIRHTMGELDLDQGDHGYAPPLLPSHTQTHTRCEVGRRN